MIILFSACMWRSYDFWGLTVMDYVHERSSVGSKAMKMQRASLILYAPLLMGKCELTELLSSKACRFSSAAVVLVREVVASMVFWALNVPLSEANHLTIEMPTSELTLFVSVFFQTPSSLVYSNGLYWNVGMQDSVTLCDRESSLYGNDFLFIPCCYFPYVLTVLHCLYTFLCYFSLSHAWYSCKSVSFAVSFEQISKGTNQQEKKIH